MKCLLTGATGFVGKVLTSKLMRESLEVRVLTREWSHSLPSCIDQFVSDYLSSPGLENKILSKALYNIHTVVHCAGRVCVKDCSEAESLRVFRAINTVGTLNLAQQAAKAGVRRFIFLSTIKVNGETTSNREAFKASDTRLPQGSYAISKAEAEIGLLALGRKTGMEIVIIRPPLVYGDGVKANFSSLMELVGRGIPLPFRQVKNNKRSLVSVYNLVDLINVCIKHPQAVNQIFLVSDDDDLSTKDMVSLMAKVQGSFCWSLPVPVFFFKMVGKLLGKSDTVDRLIGSLQIDMEHTKSVVNWIPPYSVEYGFKMAIKNKIKSEINT